MAQLRLRWRYRSLRCRLPPPTRSCRHGRYRRTFSECLTAPLVALDGDSSPVRFVVDFQCFVNGCQSHLLLLRCRVVDSLDAARLRGPHVFRLHRWSVSPTAVAYILTSTVYRSESSSNRSGRTQSYRVIYDDSSSYAIVGTLAPWSMLN